MQSPMNPSNPSVLQKNIQIPVQRTGVIEFDGAFNTLKERFNSQMKRIEAEMGKLSADIRKFYEQASNQLGAPSRLTPESVASWDAITSSSPLVQSEGDKKILKLQYDVSEFDPSEVAVKIVNDVLMVSAHHNEKTDNSVTLKEYYREFILPKGTDHTSAASSLSRDGILSIQITLPQPVLKEQKKRSPYYSRRPSIEVYYN